MAFKAGKYDSYPGVVASGDLSSYQFYVMKHASTAGACIVAVTAATDTLLGVLQNKPTSGQAAKIAFNGIPKVACETGIAAGDALTCSSTGRATKTTTDLDQVIGFALVASVTAGDILPYQASRGTLADS